MANTGSHAEHDRAKDPAVARERIGRLRDAAETLRSLALEPPPVRLTREQKREAARYAGWLRSASAKFSELADSWSRELSRHEQILARSAHADATELAMATRQMQEMNQSFSLQYLQLQNNISHENRAFTMISNVMKTKHDTARNAINSIR